VERVLRSTPWLMSALEAAGDVNAPDWLIGAGAIRTAVWDRLHGFKEPAELADLDLAFFDRDDLSPARDEAVERALRERSPDTPWDAKNQAAVRLLVSGEARLEVPPLTSTAEGVATKRITERWPRVRVAA
jgi:hypothetical protein